MRLLWIATLAFSLASPCWGQEASQLTEPEVVQDGPVITVVESYECKIAAPPGSSQIERWVWNDICLSGFSDLRYFEADPCAINDPEIDVLESVTLSSEFLVTLLTDPDYVAARQTPKVRLYCAYIPYLDLGDRQIAGPLEINNSVLGQLVLRNAKVGGDLDLDLSHIRQPLEMDGLEVNGNLSAIRTRFDSDVRLDQAQIGGNLYATGATVQGKIRAPSIRVDGSIFLNDGGNYSEIDLIHGEVGNSVEAWGSTFTDLFRADSVNVGAYVFLRDSTFDEVDLSNAIIGGNLEAQRSSFGSLVVSDATIGRSVYAGGSKFTGDFTANQVQIHGNFSLSVGATFNEVSLDGADIGGFLDASGSTFRGFLDMDELRTGGYVSINKGAVFEGIVSLRGAEIGGNLNADGATFRQRLNAERIIVEGSVLLRDGAVFHDVSLIGARAVLHLQMQGSSFLGRTNLTGATFSDVVLWAGRRADETDARRNVSWGSGASFILRNAKAVNFQARMAGADDAVDSWTREDGSRLPVDLIGFNYDQLGSIRSSDEYDSAEIDAQALVDWLDTSTAPGLALYRPQPYRVLETALRRMGDDAAATEVAYARLIHRADTRISAHWRSDFRKWVGQVGNLIFDRFLQFTIGFGVYPQIAFYWFFGLVVIGTFLARPCRSLCKGGGSRATWGDSAFYSLQNAIPLMEPSSDYAQVQHDRLAIRMFFNVQKVIGFLLATVLVGALTFGAN